MRLNYHHLNTSGRKQTKPNSTSVPFNCSSVEREMSPYVRVDKRRVYQPADRCKVIYDCGSNLALALPNCYGEMEDRLVFLKFFKGHMYIGMQKQNKYVKRCVIRKRDAATSPRHLNIDPVDRVKRFVVILESFWFH